MWRKKGVVLTYGPLVIAIMANITLPQMRAGDPRYNL
jgi:hypothetical protein